MKEKEKDKDQEEGQETSKASIKAWLPLIAALVIMPATAWAFTKLVLVEQINDTIKTTIAEVTGNPPATSKADLPEDPTSDAKSEEKGDDHGAGKGSKKKGEDTDPKVNPSNTTRIENIQFSPKGTMGKHYFVTITIKGTDKAAHDKITELKNEIQEKAEDLLSGLSKEQLDEQRSQTKATFKQLLKAYCITLLEDERLLDRINVIGLQEL
jgi:hypothetical protein